MEIQAAFVVCHELPTVNISNLFLTRIMEI